ncbi:MAG: HAD family phosphatase [Clostridia bacterium]|nr:HAD family phosphatase [Clostridia bacterium]
MNKDIKGVIFDFNGTMIFDTDIHRAVWHKFMPSLTGKPITDEEINKYIIGRGNTHIFTSYIPGISNELIEKYTYEKEAAYRDECRCDPVRFKLVRGLVEFLDCLKDKGIPMTIATGSEINNITFYFEQFGLERWFDFDKVVYDDCTFPGKPDPEVYIRAAAKLGLTPADCIIFEDSYSGVKAARAAGAALVLAVSENTPDQAYAEAGGVDAAAHDFVGYRALLGL